MLPSNVFNSVNTKVPFLYTNLEPYDPLEYVAMGGTSLTIPSNGRLVKKWIAAYDGIDITVRPEDGPIAFTLPQANVNHLSLAFTTNMDVTLAWKTSGGIKLYYYNSLTSNFIIRDFVGCTSCSLCVDKLDGFFSADSDVILGYTLNNKLYYRQQRDRYDIEYFVGDTTRLLKKVGPNEQNRLQFELVDLLIKQSPYVESNVPIFLSEDASAFTGKLITTVPISLGDDASVFTGIVITNVPFNLTR